MACVLIEGAGLAGLACAYTLHQAGVPFLIVEPSNRVGGKVATHHHPSGFLLDVGFQVLLPAYPELKKFNLLADLKLKKFNSGALVYDGKNLKRLANPVVHPQFIISDLLISQIHFADQLKLVKLITLAQNYDEDHHRLGKSILTYLREFGFTDDFMDFFWRPFLSGVLLDADLTVDAGFVLFLLRCFAQGGAAIPEEGMEQIPLALARHLPPSAISLSTEIRQRDQRSREAILGDGRKVPYTAFVEAHAPTHVRDQNYFATQTSYFSLSAPVPWESWLLLVAKPLGFAVNNIAVLSAVSPAYSPGGQQILAASVVNQLQIPEDEIARQIEIIAGRPCGLTHLETFMIERALPKTQVSKEGFWAQDHEYKCGDWYSSPSINGALRSGRMVAESILKTHSHG